MTDRLSKALASGLARAIPHVDDLGPSFEADSVLDALMRLDAHLDDGRQIVDELAVSLIEANSSVGELMRSLRIRGSLDDLALGVAELIDAHQKETP